MDNTISYKGFKAKIEFSADDNVFFGRLLGMRDIVTFHGMTVKELRAAMKETVEFYLEVSKKTGNSVRKHYSGKVQLRLPDALHAKIAEAAAAAGKSINEWGKEALESAVKTRS